MRKDLLPTWIFAKATRHGHGLQVSLGDSDIFRCLDRIGNCMQHVRICVSSVLVQRSYHCRVQARRRLLGYQDGPEPSDERHQPMGKPGVTAGMDPFGAPNDGFCGFLFGEPLPPTKPTIHLIESLPFCRESHRSPQVVQAWLFGLPRMTR